MASTSVADLEEAELRFGEALLIFWEQADLVDALFRAGKPTQTARDLLASMQHTLDHLRANIRSLALAGEDMRD